MWMYDETLAQRQEDLFEEDIANSHEVTLMDLDSLSSTTCFRLVHAAAVLLHLSRPTDASCIPRKVRHMSRKILSPNIPSAMGWPDLVARLSRARPGEGGAGRAHGAAWPRPGCRKSSRTALPELPHTRCFWFGLAALAFAAQIAVDRWARGSRLGRHALRWSLGTSSQCCVVCWLNWWSATLRPRLRHAHRDLIVVLLLLRS